MNSYIVKILIEFVIFVQIVDILYVSFIKIFQMNKMEITFYIAQNHSLVE